jgi:hypothetical protein
MSNLQNIELQAVKPLPQLQIGDSGLTQELLL